jgi:acyl-CoA oxidase
MSFHDPGLVMRYGVHTKLFLPTLMAHSTPEQLKHIQPELENWQVLGCFGMTELGNGSYIQKFETVAFYRSQTKEFELWSPTVTSTKWWIGMAAEVHSDF